MLNFSDIKEGSLYSRSQLAKIWGYKNYHAIRRGIIIPKNVNLAILFITNDSEDYKDYYDEKTLEIDGEKKHLSDSRLIEIGQNNGKIHLFYRKNSRNLFTYCGEMKLTFYQINTDQPSRFFFRKHNIVSSSKIDKNATKIEGERKLTLHYRYERNPKNRKSAIQHHGITCKTCEFNFNQTYGEDLAKDYIEVHHIKPLSDGPQEVDPKKDLVPLCANCHRIIHNKTPPLKIEELRRILQNN